MNELFKWLSANPIATYTLIISFGVLVTAIILVYLIAFFQGREISFWSPKVGPKPNKSRKNPSSSSEEEFEILDALYGPLPKTRNITKRLQARVINGKLDVIVNQITEDPAPNEPKQTKIKYRAGGREEETIYDEGERILLP